MQTLSLDANLTQRRIQGSLFAQALGDALGYHVEFDSVWPDKPRVLGLDTVLRGGVAQFSDDTQMAYAVGRGLLDPIGDKYCSEERACNVARRLAQWHAAPLGGGHRAPGGACSLGARNLTTMIRENRLEDWRVAGKPNGRGCGVVMRSAPFGWLLQDPAFAAECALMTHRSPCAQAQGAAMTGAVRAILEHDEDTSTLDPFAVARVAAENAEPYHTQTSHLIWKAMFYAMEREVLTDPVAQDCAVFDEFRGWRGDEAIAAALYAFLVHPLDVERCLLLAANTPGDSDSIASVAGALVGTYNAGVPEGWEARAECRADLWDLVHKCVEHLRIEGHFNDPRTTSSSNGDAQHEQPEEDLR